jgi:hypothetical protein
MRLIVRIRSILLAIVIGFAALWAVIGMLESSMVQAQSSSDIGAEITFPEITERDVRKDVSRRYRIQATIYLTNFPLEDSCTCKHSSSGVVDIDNDGVQDALWEASGHERTEPGGKSFEGQGVLSTDEATTVFTFENTDETIRDENDTPVGIVVSGRAQVSSNEGNKEFDFSAVVTRVPGATERLYWQITGPRISYEFEANGRLTFSQNNPGAMETQF